MPFATLDQKFEEVSESHWFLWRFTILSRVIAINSCLHTYALDSSSRRLPRRGAQDYLHGARMKTILSKTATEKAGRTFFHDRSLRSVQKSIRSPRSYCLLSTIICCNYGRGRHRFLLKIRGWLIGKDSSLTRQSGNMTINATVERIKSVWKNGSIKLKYFHQIGLMYNWFSHALVITLPSHSLFTFL